MLAQEINEQTIQALVDRFYGKVRQDKDLGPIFEAAIGSNDDDWRPHLEHMYAFWSSIMLTSGRYHGNPMIKHRRLPAFDISLFDRWLELFAETALEIHTPAVAENYIVKSRRIAASLKMGLYGYEERS
jgi:hemoglobin